MAAVPSCSYGGPWGVQKLCFQKLQPPVLPDALVWSGFWLASIALSLSPNLYPPWQSWFDTRFPLRGIARLAQWLDPPSSKLWPQARFPGWPSGLWTMPLAVSPVSSSTLWRMRFCDALVARSWPFGSWLKGSFTPIRPGPPFLISSPFWLMVFFILVGGANSTVADCGLASVCRGGSR